MSITVKKYDFLLSKCYKLMGALMFEHAFHLKLKPGALARYKELHTPVPDLITKQLKHAGVHDFSIFSDAEDIFGIMHFKDKEVFKKAMQDDVAPEWTQAVIDICESREVDLELNSLKGLERVFRLD
jgi:L-rhamnose mutarotase